MKLECFSNKDTSPGPEEKLWIICHLIAHTQILQYYILHLHCYKHTRLYFNLDLDPYLPFKNVQNAQLRPVWALPWNFLHEVHQMIKFTSVEIATYIRKGYRIFSLQKCGDDYRVKYSSKASVWLPVMMK